MSDAPTLTAVSGEIYGHLFENPRAGVARNVYWACNIEFGPTMDADGGKWPCTMLCEWIVWPVRHWRELDGMSLAQCSDPLNVEASLYFFSAHQPLTDLTLSLRHLRDDRFRLAGQLTADLDDLEGQTLRGVRASFDVEAQLQGIILVPGSLTPKANTDVEASRVLAEFADPSAYEGPRRDDFRWLFRPSVRQDGS